MAIEIKIDGYDSLEQIAVGGMAAVYKARKISIDKIVAIKVLFPYLANDESFIERFQREAKSAAQVQHENIVNVVDFGESDGCYYIVMEYYDGVTVADLLKDQTRIPLDISVSILLDVCLGLESAHAKDIIHRDIKPANIIFTRQGGIKVADFGLAKKFDSMTVVTQPGKVLGTPAYMSPEQAAGENVGPQSDIFSLGVVAFELFCHKRPFEGSSYSEVLEKIQTFTPPSIVDENPLVQPDFENIVKKMLEKDLTRRYKDVFEVIAEIEVATDKFDIKRDRRRLKKYILDPIAYEKAFNEKMIVKCLSQGTFYMQKGATHLSDAMREFKRILFLDPSNERARKHLSRLISESNSGNATLTLDKADSPGKTKKGRRLGKALVATSSKPSRGLWQKIGVPLTALTLAGGGLAGWWGWTTLQASNAGGEVPVVSSPQRITVSEGGNVEFSLNVIDPGGGTPRVYGENLPNGAELTEEGEFTWKVDYSQAGTHTLTFLADNGKSVGSATTTVEVSDTPLSVDFDPLHNVSARVGEAVEVELSASSPSGEPVRFTLTDAPRGMKLDGDHVRWTPAKNQSGRFRIGVKGTDGAAEARQTLVVSVKAKPKLERAGLLDGTGGFKEVVDVKGGSKHAFDPPPAAPANGYLSVYFLGGVGEFFVNGKKFDQQPPFTGAVVPVGTYSASCRMFRSEDSRDFQITVTERTATVVEYEVGSQPRVSQEDYEQ